MKCDNLIKFKKKKGSWQNEDSGGEVTQFTRKIVFKNANLVDVESGLSYFVDFMVENSVVSKMGIAGTLDVDAGDDVVDLEGGWVMPPFYNAFVDWKSLQGMEWISHDEKSVGMLMELMGMKNVMAGVEFYVDVQAPDILVENVDEIPENKLSEISNFLAEHGGQAVLKVGQTLEELGSVDKTFGKPLPLVLEDFGILDRDWVLVGGNCFEKDDLQVFSQSEKARIIVCPSEDAREGRRPVNVVLLKSLGFDIRIGSGRSFEVDFFAFMRQILMTQWGMYEDKSCLTEKEVLLIATGGLSRLNVGSAANFIVLKNTPSLYENLWQMLVWGKSKSDIVLTVFEGRLLQRDGLARSGITGFTYDELINAILKRTKNNLKNED